MERLTERVLGFVQLKSCENDFCKETCAEHDAEKSCNNCPIQKAYEKLAEYEDLEEQGKLLKLPGAVGDIVWDIDFGRLCSYEVTGFSFGSLNDDDWEEEKALGQVVVYYINSNGSITGTFAVSEIGKTVFLTKEEAEKALKERGKINR